MKISISESHVSPRNDMLTTGGNLVANFDLNFYTHVWDEVLEDLSITISTELPFTIKISNDLLTITWGIFNIIDLIENKNALNVSHKE